jgi:hypothetical protein
MKQNNVSVPNKVCINTTSPATSVATTVIGAAITSPTNIAPAVSVSKESITKKQSRPILILTEREATMRNYLLITHYYSPDESWMLENVKSDFGSREYILVQHNSSPGFFAVAIPTSKTV